MPIGGIGYGEKELLDYLSAQNIDTLNRLLIIFRGREEVSLRQIFRATFAAVALIQMGAEVSMKKQRDGMFAVFSYVVSHLILYKPLSPIPNASCYSDSGIAGFFRWRISDSPVEVVADWLPQSCTILFGT